MRHSDLAEYLDHDPFPEDQLPSSGDASQPAQPGSAGQVLQPSEPRPKASPPVEPTARQNTAPVPPDKPERSEIFERDKFTSDVVRMVMEMFPGARWTTREAYTRASANRDRTGRRRRG